MLEQLRRVVVSVDPDVHVGQESTLAGRTEMSYQQERLLAAMLEFTGVVAVLVRRHWNLRFSELSSVAADA